MGIDIIQGIYRLQTFHDGELLALLFSTGKTVVDMIAAYTILRFANRNNVYTLSWL